MTESEEFKSTRRLALAKLGRNVLHFQRLEAQLKILLLFCDFQSSLGELKANYENKAQSIRMKTMGGVVNELHERIYGKPPDTQTAMALTEATCAISFRVDADPNYVNRERKELNDLVTERNQLIHEDLAGFDPSSEESCLLWIKTLDEQNERILTRLKAVRQLVDTCKQALEKMLAAIHP